MNASPSTTVIRHRINASPARVFHALVDSNAVRTWMVPDGMHSRIHTFDARAGGTLRVSLTYNSPTTAGKTTPMTDTYHGRFIALEPGRLLVQTLEFETDNPAMHGEMRLTFSLVPIETGTELMIIHEHVPPGISPELNETGWHMSLAKLTRLVESGP